MAVTKQLLVMLWSYSVLGLSECRNQKDSKNFCFLIKVNEQLVDEGEVCKALEPILIWPTVDGHEKERHS